MFYLVEMVDDDYIYDYYSLLLLLFIETILGERFSNFHLPFCYIIYLFFFKQLFRNHVYAIYCIRHGLGHDIIIPTAEYG